LTFSRIYRSNSWNGVETRSGPGSGSAATGPIVRLLLELVAELAIESVVDAACGEGFWQPDLPGYLGLDVAPEAIVKARVIHPDREYKVADVSVSCPSADLILCRDAMQHLPLRDAVAVLDAIRVSGSRWLLASTYVAGHNVRIHAGGFYEPDLEAPPFDLAPALRLYHDGYDYTDGSTLRDPAKMLGLWTL
jgi:hypothetical protein